MPENQGESPGERVKPYSVNDAIYVIEQQEFVNPYPPLEGSLFEDPQSLRSAWRLVIESEARDLEKANQQGETTSPGESTSQKPDLLSQHVKRLADRLGEEPADVEQRAPGEMTLSPASRLDARTEHSAASVLRSLGSLAGMMLRRSSVRPNNRYL